jgi:hypothetical protein
MQIELKQNINTKTIRFLGEVAIRDEQKFETYKDIIKASQNEAELSDHLLREGIAKSAVSEFCKTLKRLRIIDKEGTISRQPLVGEYGDYVLKYIATDNETPYNRLPIKMDRYVQESGGSEYSESGLLNAIQEAQGKMRAESAVCSIYRIDSPILRKIEEREEQISIEINDSDDNWILRIQNNIFEMTEKMPFRKLFNDELIAEEGRLYLRLPFEKAQKIPNSANVIDSFSASFSESINTDWGKFNACYKNVDVLPIDSEVSSWYNEIFNRTLKVNGYLSQDDLKFKWDEILRDKVVLQRDEYKRLIKPFNYNTLIERYQPQKEEYWLLQAATDLNPYSDVKTVRRSTGSINIPVNDNADVQDILDNWNALKNAQTIVIVDPYANTFHAIRTLKKIFGSLDNPPQSVQIFSLRDDCERSENQRREIKDFEKQYNVHFEIREKRQIPHDRYWILDGSAFTIGISPNEIWVKNDHIEIKQQININPIDIDKLPSEIREWSK